MCVLQSQERVGGDGALALALGGGQQVIDGQLSGRERDRGGGEGLQLLEVLLLLHELVEQHLLLLLQDRERERVRESTKDRNNKRYSRVMVNEWALYLKVKFLIFSF